MVGGAAVLPVVVVVGDQVRVGAGGLQELGEGVVEGLDRPPAPVQEATDGPVSMSRRAGMQGIEPI